MADVDNEISRNLLQISEVTSRLKRLQQSLDEQNAAMQQQNNLISRAEIEITKNNALVERKQTQVDQLNKKIDQTISKLGVSLLETMCAMRPVYAHMTNQSDELL